MLLVSAASVRAADAPVAADAPTVDILWTETKRYSYGSEELIIRDFFQDRRGGFFVDVGCAWPIKNSNTYYLEKHLGWKGIGIDGLPDFADNWARRRPNSTFLNFLVSDHSDTEERFYKVPVWGLSTAEAEVAATMPLVDEIEVPSITLDDLLERFGVTKVDFVSIDVEGHQAKVLAGFDVQRWKPELVCIEDDGELSIPWFKERGYAPIERYRARDIVNWYFAPVEIAAKVNARETERGREERRKMEEMLAKEPSGSSVRAYWTPKYLLGPDGMPVLNPRWEPPEVWQRAAQEGGDPAKVGDDIAKEGGDAAPASAVVADAAAPSKAPGAATASSALTSPAPQRSEDALRPEEAPRPEAKPQGEGGH